MLAFEPSQALHSDVDQTLRVRRWVVAAALPPHGAAQAYVLDVLDLLSSDLWAVVGDHGLAGWVVAPGSHGLVVVVDLCAGAR